MSCYTAKVVLRLAALAVLVHVAPSVCVAEDRALIIGINRYPHIPDRLQLTGAVNDARMMQKVARNVWGFPPASIKLLLDHEATSKSIVAAIENWLVEGTRRGDRVLLTYAGHGYFQRNTDGNEPTGFDQTLAPHDVQRVDAGYINMIADDRMGELLKRLEGREVMLVIDSCHSGTITRALDPKGHQGPSIVRSLGAGGQTRSLTEPSFQRLRSTRSFVAEHPHVMAWTAVASTELAEEDMSLPDDNRLGVFTRALVEGLLERRADANRNGVITPFELIHYVRRRTSDYCDQHRCRTRMTPTLEWPATFMATNLLAWGSATVNRPPPVAFNHSASKEPRPPPAPTPHSLASGIPQDVLLHDNALGIRLDLLPAPTMKLGEQIKVRVVSARAGYLIVLDVRDNGSVVQLFPSKCSRRERLLRAGIPLTMPDQTYGCVFEATQPGEGQIVAIVTRDNVPIDALLARHRDLEIVPEDSDYLAVIAKELAKVWTGDARNRPIQWSMTGARYEVVK